MELEVPPCRCPRSTCTNGQAQGLPIRAGGPAPINVRWQSGRNLIPDLAVVTRLGIDGVTVEAADVALALEVVSPEGWPPIGRSNLASTRRRGFQPTYESNLAGGPAVIVGRLVGDRYVISEPSHELSLTEPFPVADRLADPARGRALTAGPRPPNARSSRSAVARPPQLRARRTPRRPGRSSVSSAFTARTARAKITAPVSRGAPSASGMACRSAHRSTRPPGPDGLAHRLADPGRTP